MTVPDLAPTLLVLDTSTEHLHLGLLVRGSPFTRCLTGGAQASATLLPALQGLLDEAQIGWAALDAIGYGRGPGAFTGVRAACAVTQGLAEALGKPVLGLDTLLAVADDARAQGAGARVRVAVDARMGEVYSAAFCHDARDGWHMLDEPALQDPAELVRGIEAGVAVAGNSLLAHADAWQAFTGPRFAEAVPRAEALLRLALRQWQAGERRDAAEALPLYVRDRVALTTVERDAVRLAKAGAA